MSKRQDTKAPVNWRKLFSGIDRLMIATIMARLQEDEIVCVEFDQQDSSYLVFGQVHIMVPEEQYARAKEILEGMDLNLGDA